MSYETYEAIAHLIVLLVAVPALAFAAWISAKALIQCHEIKRKIEKCHEDAK